MNAIAGTIPLARKAQKSYESRPWLVIHDPSGDFLNSTFRAIDLDVCLGGWPEGIIFWHRGSGEIRIWRGNRYTRLSPKRAT